MAGKPGGGVSTDSAGNAYVAGDTDMPWIKSNSSLGDVFVRMHDGDGCAVWARLFDPVDYQHAAGVSTDTAGNAYVAGYTDALPGPADSGVHHEAFLLKYDPKGNELWTRQFGYFTHDSPFGVCTDASGNAYVAGQAGGAPFGSHDGFLRKYDPDGNERWTRQFGSGGDDCAYGVSNDASGNAYVAGSTTGALPGQASSGGLDAFLRKYDPDGNELWTRQFGSGGDDCAYGVSADASGVAYVAGQADGALCGSHDGFLRKYDPHGNHIWTR